MSLPNRNDCIGCGNCILSCSAGALTMSKDDCGNVYPVVDGEKCKECGRCEKVCPQSKVVNKNTIIRAYVGWINDDFLRKKAASGGIASALSKHFIKCCDGISNGVVMSDDYEAKHIVLGESDILKSCNSKYTFSYMGKIVTEVADALSLKRKCLFIGLPCQCAAVIAWCTANSIDTESLYVVDLACHGVSSGEYLKEHIAWVNNKNKAELRDVCFRDHEIGSKKAYVFSLKSKEGQVRYKKAVWSDDFYQIAYHTALMYRDNCYRCKYACCERTGDLTLADAYWMKNEKDNQRDYFRGASCILANTSKGIELIEKMSEHKEIIISKIDVKKAVCLVAQFHEPSKPSRLRKLFLDEYRRTNDFDQACAKVLKTESLKRRLFFWIRPNLAALLRNEKKLGRVD